MCIAEVATARGVAAALWACSSLGEASLLPCVGVPKTRDPKDFSKASANALHTTHGVGDFRTSISLSYYRNAALFLKSRLHSNHHSPSPTSQMSHLTAEPSIRFSFNLNLHLKKQ